MAFKFKKAENRLVLLNNVLPGVKRIARAVSGDFELVFEAPVEIIETCDTASLKKGDIVVTTDPEKLEGEQCFSVHNIDEKLFVTGADLLGTIYGMFHVSEMIGVSALVYFADAAPLKRSSVELSSYDFTSKVPSVKYRGFFINDEWPCFGTWMSEKFGGANAKCYEVIFEFLLRMKGNYLWPAMWASSFPCDGPGTLNEELATELGIYVSYSHHEPCLRASEEWKHVCGPESKYGSKWNFDENREGLLNYWRDGLKRSGKYTHFITIGMRGEYDSVLLENATLAYNIENLKRVIIAQKELIKELDIHLPLTLAVYKEVEQYFYGDETTKGLMEWDGLDDVMLMLCEDNHGHMRGLPTQYMRDRYHNYGMYFHLDYHGGPVSFEWVNSTTFSQVWEEMTECYDFGIQNAWIVNVGDIKFNEIPLYYFMQIAYDFDKWGSKNLNSPREFTFKLIDEMFPGVSESLRDKLAGVITDSYYINSIKRPETVHQFSFNACKDYENDKFINTITDLERRADEIYSELDESYRDAYYSGIYWPLKASANLYLMWLYSDKNIFLARQGRSEAIDFAKLAKERIALDRKYCEDWKAFKSGKWNGMQLEAHTGFTAWNDADMRLPLVVDYTPNYRDTFKTSFGNEERVYTAVYGKPLTMVSEYMNFLEVSNAGIGAIGYTISDLETGAEVFKGTVSGTDIISLFGTKSEGIVKHYRISADDRTVIDLETRGYVPDFKQVDRSAYGRIDTLVSLTGVTLQADEYSELRSGVRGEFKLLKGYGKYNKGLKVLDTVEDFTADEQAPEAVYKVEWQDEADVTLELLTAPTNPLKYGGALNVLIKINDGDFKAVNLVPDDFKSGENSDFRWCRDVIAQERRTLFDVHFNKGINSITIKPLEIGVILERINLYGKTNTH